MMKPEVGKIYYIEKYYGCLVKLKAIHKDTGEFEVLATYSPFWKENIVFYHMTRVESDFLAQAVKRVDNKDLPLYIGYRWKFVSKHFTEALYEQI